MGEDGLHAFTRLAGSTVVGVASRKHGGGQAQQVGVTGRVTEAGSALRSADAQVFIVGTNLGGLTNQDGRYLLRNVPAGAQQVRVIRSASRDEAAGHGGRGSVDHARHGAHQVGDLAAGGRDDGDGRDRRVEIGNAISNVDAKKNVESTPISTVSTC